MNGNKWHAPNVGTEKLIMTIPCSNGANYFNGVHPVHERFGQLQLPIRILATRYTDLSLCETYYYFTVWRFIRCSFGYWILEDWGWWCLVGKLKLLCQDHKAGKWLCMHSQFSKNLTRLRSLVRHRGRTSTGRERKVQLGEAKRASNLFLRPLLLLIHGLGSVCVSRVSFIQEK